MTDQELTPEYLAQVREQGREWLWSSDHDCGTDSVFCEHWFFALDRLISFERAEAALKENEGWRELMGTDHGAAGAYASCERDLRAACRAIEEAG